MKNTFWLIILILLESCSKKNIIYYTYNGVTITRIDREDQSGFYYGRIRNNSQSYKANIVATHDKGSDVMAGYLVFKPDKKVELIVIGDKFKTLKYDSLFKMLELDNERFIYWSNKYKKDHDNIVRFDDVLRIEKKLNSINKSNVVIEY